MSDFSDRPCGSRRRPDPRKRVNYSLGLVLGEDEFVQDQVHLRERDHLGVRALHGYGTVSGLAVTWDEPTGEVRVAPGLAVDAAGRLVCVPSEQCADLGRWLTDNRAAISEAAEVAEGDLPDEVSLYVVLCYRECATDTVPVPSETCRTGDESMAASRILESFELRLSLDPPAPAGELIDGALPQAVERLLELLETSPGDPGTDVDELRRELESWATRDRPELADGRPCLKAPDDDCAGASGASTGVLLGRVDLGLAAGPDDAIVAVDPEVVEDDRPVLLSTRFLQEWLIGLMAHPDLLAPSDHNLLDNLDADDHPHYLLADGSRALTGPLDAGGNQLRNLAASSAGTHAMRRNEIVGGDLEAGGAGLRIVALQGERLTASDDDAPSAGDVLRFDGDRWAPAALPDAPGEPSEPGARVGTVLPFVSIELLGRQQGVAMFLLWFHLDAPDASVVLAATGRGRQPLVYGEGLEILTEACEEGRPVLRRVATNRVEVAQVSCNVFRVAVNRQDAELLRFVFHLRELALDTGVTVSEYAQEEAITWVGQGPRDTVTSFVVNPSLGRPIDGFDGIDSIVIPTGGGRLPLDDRR